MNLEEVGSSKSWRRRSVPIACIAARACIVAVGLELLFRDDAGKSTLRRRDIQSIEGWNNHYEHTISTSYTKSAIKENCSTNHGPLRRRSHGSPQRNNTPIPHRTRPGQPEPNTRLSHLTLHSPSLTPRQPSCSSQITFATTEWS